MNGPRSGVKNWMSNVRQCPSACRNRKPRNPFCCSAANAIGAPPSPTISYLLRVSTPNSSPISCRCRTISRRCGANGTTTAVNPPNRCSEPSMGEPPVSLAGRYLNEKSRLSFPATTRPVGGALPPPPFPSAPRPPRRSARGRARALRRRSGSAGSRLDSAPGSPPEPAPRTWCRGRARARRPGERPAARPPRPPRERRRNRESPPRRRAKTRPRNSGPSSPAPTSNARGDRPPRDSGARDSDRTLERQSGRRPSRGPSGASEKSIGQRDTKRPVSPRLPVEQAHVEPVDRHLDPPEGDPD